MLTVAHSVFECSAAATAALICLRVGIVEVVAVADADGPSGAAIAVPVTPLRPVNHATAPPATGIAAPTVAPPASASTVAALARRTTVTITSL